jgi:hypothetical protein
MKRMIVLLLLLVIPSFSVKAGDAPPELLNAIGIQESGMKPFPYGRKQDCVAGR